MKKKIFFLILFLTISLNKAQCPWQLTTKEHHLTSACTCSYNLGHELSVQCDMVEWSKLLIALQTWTTNITLDLLYVNNSTIGTLKDNIFANLKVQSIQLSSCKINSITLNAFKGQENYLRNLNLQDNDLSQVPVDSLKSLKNLLLLDLSHNRLQIIPNGAFETLTKLTTLKLNDNNIYIEKEALRGLRNCLKNLNLKGTRQKDIPEAIQGMNNLAFLDMSQNSLRQLPATSGLKSFSGLNSLTALNLERNLLQILNKNAFQGVEQTLSSLSLLNNLLSDFPKEATSVLSELKVLDIGFNLITELPQDAFKGNPLLTLLALDGNPLPTIPFNALSHLNNTLKGLSVGGRFLHCDCRLSWISYWIKNGNLQVTSRERNPQFCGSPPKFRDRGFYSIQPHELTCNSENITSNIKPTIILSSSTSKPTSISSSTLITTTTTTTTKTTFSPTNKITNMSTISTTTTTNNTNNNNNNNFSSIKTNRNTLTPSHTTSKYKQVTIKNAFRQDNSVIIQWSTITANILGFRVIYRLFGDVSFKQGPPLDASEREFKIKHVPSQECIIVCVISLEEINIAPDNVPYKQCREVRTLSLTSSNMDKITIAASAAICSTIVVAVIIFVIASKKKSKKLHSIHQHKTNIKSNLPLPINGLPINCFNESNPTTILDGPTLLSPNVFNNNNNNNNKEWDQISGYSSHSIQRSRLYTTEQSPSSLEEMRYNNGNHKAPRSIADGQSQHSFSNTSGRYLTCGFPNNFQSSRTDLRQTVQPPPVTHHSRHSRPRSRSRDHNRPYSRYSNTGSTRTSLNNYCDNLDNWTDHDMDIYMARNPTTRNGLVPL